MTDKLTKDGTKLDTLKVGLIGTGDIAPAYIKGCAPFDVIDIVACADVLPDKARAFAATHGLQAHSVDHLLARPDIDIVINATVPTAHVEVSLQIIRAGKHAYSEKPLAISRAEAASLLQAARAAGLRLGCAPDALLGGGNQTARQAIDEGAIGQPVAANTFFMTRGPESWHPNPDIFYQIGGGPLLDMGPYFVTALVHLLGPVARVSALARKSFPQRIATSQMHMGRALPVEVNTHIAGTLEFTSGAIASLITSFDVWAHHLPALEVHGSAGSLSLQKPNMFDGAVSLLQAGSRQWAALPHTHTINMSRGAGVADMAYAIQSGRAHRASADLAYHVLDILQTLEESAANGQHVTVQSTVERPQPLPAGLADGELDI